MASHRNQPRRMKCGRMIVGLALTMAGATAWAQTPASPELLTGKPRLPLSEAKTADFKPRTFAPPADVKVRVPADWAGRRIFLYVGYLNFAANAVVNGKDAGDLMGYGDEVDVTGLVDCGAENRIQLQFPKDAEGLKIDKYTEALIKGRGWGAGVGCGGDLFYLESRPQELSVDDVWYRTYTRGYQRINAQTTVFAARPMTGLKARLRIFQADKTTPAKEAEYTLRPLAAGENVVDLPMTATDLKQWDLRQPNLYWGQVVIVGADGKELDCSEPVRFGIREFWAQGRQFWLNNHPVYFTYDNSDTSGRTVKQMFDLGVTLLEENGNGSDPTFVMSSAEGTLQEADTLGMACMAPGVEANSMYMRHSPDLKDPLVMRDYMTWVRKHQKRIRNHPSLFFYTVACVSGISPSDNACTGVGRSSHLLWNLPDSNSAHLLNKEADPTRLSIGHGCTAITDAWTSLIYFNHTPTQEVEDWLEDWVASGDRPALAPEFLGRQFAPDYTKGGSAYFTEYAAVKAGDRAYVEEKDEYIKYSNVDWMRNRDHGKLRPFDKALSATIFPQIIEAQDRVNAVWRFQGVPVMNWHWRRDGVEIHDAYAKLLKPAYTWLGGPARDFTAKDHNFFSGDSIEKSVVVIRDLLGADEWDAAWTAKLRGADKPVAEGRITQSVGPFAHQTWPFSLVAPAVDKPTPLELSYTLTASKSRELIGTGAFTCTIHPRPKPEAIVADGWTILDPEGKTAAWLRELGLNATPFDKGVGNATVLLVGRRALRGLAQLPFTAADVEKGLRVVVFEQHCAELGNLGFRVEDRCPRNAFVRHARHPLAAGLDDETLRDWRGEATLYSRGPERDQALAQSHFYRAGNRGSVASTIIETPHYGPFWSVVDCEFDLSYSPLLSWRHGKGEVLYCTLDLVGRVGVEPGATTFAHNLVRYLRQPLRDAPQSRLAASFDEPTVKHLGELGFAALSADDGLDARGNILVMESPRTDALAQKRDVIQKFLDAGGDMLVLYADQTLLADPLFRNAVQVEEVEVSRAGRTVEEHQLLTGVGPQHIHWRAPLTLKALTAVGGEFTPLLGGLAGEMKSGKGRIIFLQTDPAAVQDCSAVDKLCAPAPIDKAVHHDSRHRSGWQINRLHSLLLANLGVQSNPALVRRLFTVEPAIGQTPINRWVWLGPIPPPADPQVDCLAQDFTQYLNQRDTGTRMKNSRGETMEWYMPTDSLNGLGMDGFMDFAKHYPRQLRDTVIAVTHVWSSRPREATIQFGADWWLSIRVNGKEVFSTSEPGWPFATKFDNKRKVSLHAGWNEIVCLVGAGSNGHQLWFRMSDPGDLRYEPSTTKPVAPPKNLPAVADLAADDVVPAFVPYTEPIRHDPFAFVGW